MPQILANERISSALKDSSRLWIFTTAQAINAQVESELHQYVNQFLAQWKAHGKELSASFDILYNRVLLVAVDEEIATATGCSIDSMVRLFSELDKKFDLDLFNRQRIVLVDESKVESQQMNQIVDSIKSGSISPEQKMVDATLTNLGQFRQKGVIAISDSWLSQFI